MKAVHQRKAWDVARTISYIDHVLEWNALPFGNVRTGTKKKPAQAELERGTLESLNECRRHGEQAGEYSFPET